MERTREQKLAINSTGNVIVSAGAGSGKTSILTERIFVNILNGVKLDEILILTFANDAANEMRVRLKKQLGADERTKNLVPIVDAANICTFDAYFLFLVQKYSARLGVSSDVSVIPDDIISVKKNELLRSYLEEMAENPTKVDEIIFQNYNKKQPGDFIKVLNRIDKVFENTTDYEALKERLLNEFLTDEAINKFFDEKLTPKLKDEFYEIIKLVESSSDEAFVAEFYNVFGSIVKNFNFIDLARLYSNNVPVLKGNTKKKDEFKIAAKDALATFKKQLSGIPIDTILDKDVKFNRIVIPRLIDIIERLNNDIKKYKFEKNAFTFTDIANMAFNLLKDNDDIRNEIKNKLKLIMIDEYQDTSIFQEQFINMIENNNNFVVGDVKQSIYAFRGANPQQFMDKYRNYKANKGGMAIDMNINFRSRAEVTEGINKMFAEVMTLDYGGADYKKEHIIEHGNIAYENEGKTSNPHGLFSLEFRGYKNSSENTRSEILAIVKNIKTRISRKMQVFDRDLGHLRDCEYRDFAILIAKGTKFQTIEKIFNDEGIPINAVYDENIISDDAVIVLINILKMISYFNNSENSEINEKHAFFSILRSFLYRASDEELYNLSIDDKYKTCSEYLDLKQFALNHKNSLIHDIYIDVLNDFEFMDKLTLLGNAIDKLRYNRIFYDRTKLMDNFGYTLDNFIEYLESLNELGIEMESRTASDVKNAVTLTTIHKSKGLEFGIVYFPFSRSGPKADSSEIERFFINKEYGVFLPSLYTEKNSNIHSLFQSYYTQTRNQSELIRLLYVGLTRAEEEAIILNERNATLDEYLSDFNAEDLENIRVKNNLETIDSAIKWVKMEYKEKYGPKDEDIYEDEDEEPVEFVSLEDQINDQLSSITAVGDLFDITTYNFEDEYYHTFEPIESKNDEVQITYESIAIDNYRYEFKPLPPKVRASKVKSDIANAGALKFGTHLHLLLEGVDFKTKDTSFIKNSFEKQKIDEILKNHIFDGLENAIFYKEYEYFDEINNMIGIIDLLIEKEDELLVIDYKTKNINDSDYDKQLNIYKQYVERTFKKKAKCYLLSIMDNEIREIK